MIKEISKKLTMKKSFFVTQLEGFFNAISQEYQDLIHQKEVENSLLEEKIQKLEKDISNLARIREHLQEQLREKEAYIQKLENDLVRDQDAQYKKLLEENRTLKAELSRQNESQEVQALKQQIEKLQKVIASAGKSYHDTLTQQSKEALIEEISKSLKK